MLTLIDASNRQIGQRLIILNGEIKGLQSLLVIHLPVTCLISERERKKERKIYMEEWIRFNIFLMGLFSPTYSIWPFLDWICIQWCAYLNPAWLISLISHFLSAVKIYWFASNQTGGHILKIDVYLFSGGEKCQILGSTVDHSDIVYIWFMTHIFNLVIYIGFIGWPCILL